MIAESDATCRGGFDRGATTGLRVARRRHLKSRKSWIFQRLAFLAWNMPHCHEVHEAAMKNVLTLLSVLITGVVAMFWTGAGESSNPALTERELPAEIVDACTATAALEACRALEFNRHWVGRSARGDLYVVTNDRCRGEGCRAWLIEKTATAVRTLLAFEKTFRVFPATGSYPVIETYTGLSATESAYCRFEWNGQAYVRTASRLVYRVDGIECGTREQCRAAADEALKRQQIDRAVKIWEDVHGISWI
jgi:hypothetical protein